MAGDSSFQRFSARITFTNQLDAETAVRHLREQHFIVGPSPPREDPSEIVYLVHRDKDCRTSIERVRNYMKTLIHACGGNFVDITE